MYWWHCKNLQYSIQCFWWHYKNIQYSLQCFWFTGLSGSGKSTLAIELEKELHKKGYLIKLLDGDNVRTGINKNLGFSETNRNENIRRIAEINKLFIETGVIAINTFVKLKMNCSNSN